MFGPQRGLRTNSQGFRSDHDFAPSVKPGTRRVVCSGDSFTFGYGVADESAWCNRLGTAQVEAANLGQSGYGIDQAFLAYQRDGLALEHQLHIFAFIRDDFRRMTTTDFHEYGKPVLTLKEGKLVAGNVPVPRGSYYFPALTRDLSVLKASRTWQLLSGLLPQPPPSLPATGVEELAFKAFEEIRGMDAAKGVKTAFLFLPMQTDYRNESSKAWRQKLREGMQARGLPYWDATDRFDGVPKEEIASFFIQPDSLPMLGAAGHFTDKGNALVSLFVRDEVFPDLSSILAVRTNSPRRK
jgi:hypothetical protein